MLTESDVTNVRVYSAIGCHAGHDTPFEIIQFHTSREKEYYMIMNQYPLLSLPESEILKRIETETGARELERQADSLHADMIRAAQRINGPGLIRA